MTPDEYLSDKIEVPFDEVVPIPYNELSGYLEEYASQKVHEAEMRLGAFSIETFSPEIKKLNEENSELQKENEQLKIKLEIAELEKTVIKWRWKNNAQIITDMSPFSMGLKQYYSEMDKISKLKKQLTINFSVQVNRDKTMNPTTNASDEQTKAESASEQPASPVAETPKTDELGEEADAD